MRLRCEFEQGRLEIEAFRAAYPEYFIILTFSPSATIVRRNYAGADYTGIFRRILRAMPVIS